MFGFSVISEGGGENSYGFFYNLFDNQKENITFVDI